MILPTTYVAALLLAVLTMICWGSWANTVKMTGKWRFELYYFDFAFGVLVTSILLAVTLGQMGSELTFEDNLLIVGRRGLALAFMAGGIFNLANMLLVAAISVAGMTVAFPIAIGLALPVGLIVDYVLSPQGNPVPLYAGALCLVASIVITTLTYRAFAAQRNEQRAVEANEKGKRPPRRIGVNGVVLSLAGGLLMGLFYPVIQLSRAGELGLRCYAVAFIFALGVFLSTPFYNLMFMNLPVQGKPVGLKAYIRGTATQHLLGVAGGAIWLVGAVAFFAASSTVPEVQVDSATAYTIGQGAALIAALWGLLRWKEFESASKKVHNYLWIMLGLFAVGLGVIAVGPLFL